MMTTIEIADEVSGYRRHVDDLYRNIRQWIGERRPDAAFSQTQIELSEEATGIYELASLDVCLPGLETVRFVPRGTFVIGAHGRVDVHSRLGREVLLWVEASEKSGATRASSPEMEISRPLFDNVAEGWAWSDERHAQVLALTQEILWGKILAPLTHWI